MPTQSTSARSHLTLGLCTILHAFTHAYGSMLVPLYFRIAADLKLSGVGAATLIVTLYGATYNLGSWAGGLAADRFSRKTLLAIGLFGNAAAICGIGFSREYPVILALAMAAGLFGTIFHPAALSQIPGPGDRPPQHRLGSRLFLRPANRRLESRLCQLAFLEHRPMAKTVRRNGDRRCRRRDHLPPAGQRCTGFPRRH
jgi:hypothetical protein